MNFAYFIISLLLTSLSHSCDWDSVDMDDFNAQDYFKICNWEDMKHKYYDEKNTDEQDAVAIAKIETAFARMKATREEIIYSSISANFGDNCLLVSFNQLTLDEHSNFASIEKLMNGENKFWRCGNELYILNSFGSQTLTSDFDFSMVKRDISKLISSYNLDILNIMEVARYLAQTFEFISIRHCGSRPAEVCLDSNGYPDIMIYFTRYFTFFDFNYNANNQAFRYSNMLSARILKYCVIAPLHYFRLSEFNDEYTANRSDLVAECYKNIMAMILKVELKYKTPMEYEDKERLFDPFSQDEEEKNKAVYNPDLSDVYVDNLTNLADFILSERDFLKCVANVDNPRYFLIRSFRLENDIRTIKSMKTTYEVFDDLFMLPASFNINRTDIVNRLIPIFLGACHLWASEAYVTFGALSFVKQEKKLLAQTDHLECQLYLESFIENMGMLLFHMAEFIEANEVAKENAIEFQSISDTLSKYLRRALLSITMPCVNDLAKVVDGFWTPNGATVEIKKHQYFVFYELIKGVDQKALDKKEQYFAKYKEVFVDVKLEDLVKIGVVFFESLYVNVLQNLAVDQLF